MDYYNEFDEYPLQWLRNLHAAGHIPAGTFDGRSIVDVKAEDVKAARQAHFFAGIGGWPLALKLAGWPEDQEVWTGSCPCQPFSVAGGRKGTKDKRHLWPDFFRLIRECIPPVVFGEQVASKDGRAWLSGVRDDLESLGYEVGAADLCAASAGEEGEGWILRGDRVFIERTIVGAPHLRQRLFWVAKSKSFRYRPPSLEPVAWGRECAVGQDDGDVAGRVANAGASGRRALQRAGRAGRGPALESSGHVDFGRLADSQRQGLEGLQEQYAREEREAAERSGVPSRVADRKDEIEDRGFRKRKEKARGGEPGTERCRPACGLANGTEVGRGQELQDGCRKSEGSSTEGRPPRSPLRGPSSRMDDSTSERAKFSAAPIESEDRKNNGLLKPSGRWSRFDVLPCSDKRARRVESGTFPLAHGVPGRVGKLRAYGNAIVSELAAEFIQAFLEACSLR